MARAAGAGLVVGVLSGVSSTKDIAPYADIIIDSVDNLTDYAEWVTAQAAEHGLNGLNPDIAFD